MLFTPWRSCHMYQRRSIIAWWAQKTGSNADVAIDAHVPADPAVDAVVDVLELVREVAEVGQLEEVLDLFGGREVGGIARVARGAAAPAAPLMAGIGPL